MGAVGRSLKGHLVTSEKPLIEPVVVLPWWLSLGDIPKDNFVSVYQPKGAASYSDSLVNKAKPGWFDALSEGTTPPTLDSAKGWLFNTNRSYLNTFMRPGFNWSFIVEFNSVGFAGVNSAIVAAWFTDTHRYGIFSRFNTNGWIFANNEIVSSATGTILSGTFGLSGVKGYINGVHVATSPGVSNVAVPTTIRIANEPRGTSVLYQYYGYISKLIFWDVALTDAQMLNYHNLLGTV